MQYKALVLSFSFSICVLVPGIQANTIFRLGAPSTLLNQLEAENTKGSKVYTFITSSAEQIKVDVEDYYNEGGYLSMVGRAQESKNSDFILKGSEKEIYGWLVLKDKNIAYEYTTDRYGDVVVQRVPVEKIFPICANDDEGVGMASEPAQRPGPEPHIGPYPTGLAVNKFQSKPGAPKVLYWDITNAATVWPPEGMWEAWQTFSSQYSMFDVNVTTDPDVYEAAGVANRGSCHQVSTTGQSSCGLSSFGTSRACNIFKKSSPAYQGGTLAHETGHQVGLNHDGSSSGGEYFSGLAAFQWVPTMGVHAAAIGYAQGALQWSKGEYSGANQTEDDLNIITVTRKFLSFRTKTHNGVVPLNLTGTVVDPLLNRGQIVKNTDVDVFSFQIAGGAGHAKLTINRTERAYGSMLDIDATLFDGTGKSLGQSNKPANRSAEFDLPLPVGNYTLAIKGGAEGTPSAGFSNYSSLGFYAIEGVISGAVAVKDKTDLRQAIRVYPMTTNGLLRLDIPSQLMVYNVTVITLAGSMVFYSQKKVEAIDLSKLPTGLYVVSMIVEGAHLSWKIAKP